MPRLPIDYSKAFIYKLCCKDKSIDECYIGSSTNWVKRKNGHKNDCNNVKRKTYNQKKYVFIRDNGGWDNWEMILIHNYPCNDKRELEKEEERVRCEYYNNINSYRAYITDEERKEHKKENHKQYYNNNKDKLKEYHKQYYNNNKDKTLEQQKQYRIDNKDKILQQKKQYYIDNRDKTLEQQKQRYIDNKDKILEKIICECGCEVVKIALPRHKQTNKHKKLVQLSQK